MAFYKETENGVVLTVGTVNVDGGGNISEEEYNEILSMLKNAPAGKVVVEDGTGYAYADAPEPQDEDLPAEAIAEILLEGVTE